MLSSDYNYPVMKSYNLCNSKFSLLIIFPFWVPVGLKFYIGCKKPLNLGFKLCGRTFKIPEINFKFLGKTQLGATLKTVIRQINGDWPLEPGTLHPAP